MNSTKGAPCVVCGLCCFEGQPSVILNRFVYVQGQSMRFHEHDEVWEMPEVGKPMDIPGTALHLSCLETYFTCEGLDMAHMLKDEDEDDA